MTEKPENKPANPSPSEAGQVRAESREARRAAALRANLKRRKAQTHARHNDGETGEPADGSPDPKA